jgi:integrase
MIPSSPGGRPRTGSTYVKNGKRVIAVTTWRENATKPRWVRPAERADGAPMTEEEARGVARELQGEYDAGTWDPWAPPPPPTPKTETLAAYSERWLKHRREVRGLRSVDDDESRLKHWILEEWGSLPMRDVTRVHIEAMRDHLDVSLETGLIRWKTATNIWTVCTSLFDDATNAKARTNLRVLDANPCIGVRPPEKGEQRAKTFLYPSEFLGLMQCELVDVTFRRLVAIAVYTFMREGELAALEWAAVDLEHGQIHVHQAENGKTFEVGRPKTAAGVRTVPIEPALVPLLEQMRRERPTDRRVFPAFPAQRDASAWLRKGLLAAGAKREALHVASSDTTRLALRFHDLRSTGITWCGVRGDSDMLVIERAGHEDWTSTKEYMRRGTSLRTGFGAVFPALPAGLFVEGSAPSFATEFLAPIANLSRRLPKHVVPAAGLEPSRSVTDVDIERHSQVISSEAVQPPTPSSIRKRGSATGGSETPVRGDGAVLFETLEGMEQAWIAEHGNLDPWGLN